jgi:hypothetical protein
MKNLNLDTSKELLHANIQNMNLRRHCYAVGYTLRALYEYYKSAEGTSSVEMFSKVGGIGSLGVDQWQITGILHDSDWELTTSDETKHTVLLLEWLRDYDAPEEMLNVFKSHNNKRTHLREPETLLEWSLETCDELTGFIVAVALVRPEKKLEFVEVDNVIKKFKQKEFARAVDREQISQCEVKLGISLNKFVEITLNSMKANSAELGL